MRSIAELLREERQQEELRHEALELDLIGAEARDRFTLATEFATRNVAVAIAIAVTLLHRAEFATFATTYLLTETPLLLLAVYGFRARMRAPVTA